MCAQIYHPRCLAIKPDNFTHQGENAGAQWVNYNFTIFELATSPKAFKQCAM